MMRVASKSSVRIAAMVMLLLAAAPASPQSRIRFARGRTTAVVNGTVIAGNTVYYILGARRGQTMSVHLSSRGNRAVFELYAIRGVSLAENTNDWEGVLPETNDYMIAVTATGRRTGYTLEVTIR